MADESSEGKRYSYKKPKPEPQKRRKPETDTPRRRVAQKDVPRRETPAEEMRRRGLDTKAGKVVRDKDRSREMPKSKPRSETPWRDGVNVDKTTPADRKETAGYRRQYELLNRDRAGDETYDHPSAYRAPEPIDDRSANPPENRPSPMIRAGVGPVAQLSSQVAHTYGYTPEAYNELASIPTSLRPPAENEQGYAGAYYPGEEDRLFLNSTKNASALPGTLAHEQAHANWFHRGMEGEMVKPGYASSFDTWRQDPAQGITGSVYEDPNSATFAQDDINRATNLGFYPDPGTHPTELYARTVQFSPNQSRQDWPDSVRPYYSGFLQGMDRLQGGGPTPELTPVGLPDASGAYGSPIPRWR
jgi:hypothetical protein